ncbi:nucleotide exchange factor GrpE [Roseobacter sp. HKCCD9010]|jgi:molecular chaperone GrpE|uniref:nucleotide exchange factor GrpE n=1 Tax=Rhodobacterales TaxID=204455 RepID=UPI001198F4AC|nr:MULTISPECIES: nucleotide exchange factor GrpE [Rhodobacterales]MBF9048432.1 nucleotide exchange factor GrpE [Rhodobacterales bacterium HKCCD4356]NNV10431.1 nucleotide exchange factor GrpE [Roseobacter sp. HKCCD7357]NNV14616.1 nucleotide exchange factor GrpE [Roseobacter sp. HKCCD8768]NNV24075.1 nucleotide exchange factor GrpE [Roseobacter sp. HKCCD8192]NNV28332.1 nucleotide exchange factor GrpE [Roseobacter sp. HKCCD9061]
MADPKEDPFLDDVDEIEADLDAMLEAEGAFDPEVTEVDALKAERDELKDRLLRVLADSENMRKRGERDRREAEHYGGSRLARDLLPVYDNLRRALDAVNDDQRAVAGGVIDGVELTLRELLNVFSKHGMTPIAPEEGDQFDPQQHQAMFEAPVPGTTAGQIIQVMAEGFMLHDRLLRPAQVGVSSTPAG